MPKKQTITSKDFLRKKRIDGKSALKVYRMKIVGFADGGRPDWAKTENVNLADHPKTKVGYLTKHFYSDTVNLNDTLPTWTYGPISNYDFGSIFWSLFFIIIGSFIIMNSEDADKIEGIRRKK